MLQYLLSAICGPFKVLCSTGIFTFMLNPHQLSQRSSVVERRPMNQVMVRFLVRTHDQVVGLALCGGYSGGSQSDSLIYVISLSLSEIKTTLKNK